MRALIIALMMLTAANAGESNPYNDMEQFECYAETGQNCEESAREWADEHGLDDIEDEYNEEESEDGN